MMAPIKDLTETLSSALFIRLALNVTLTEQTVRCSRVPSTSVAVIINRSRLTGHNVLFLHNNEWASKSAGHPSVLTADVDLM